MPLFNVYLEQDAPGHVIADPEARRDTWNTEPLVEAVVATDPGDLTGEIDTFVSTFVKPEWIEPSGEPKRELILFFTVNKKVMSAILEQDNCAGVRIFMSSKGTTTVTTNIIIKPVNARLEELDTIPPSANILFSQTLTECPPKTNCPSAHFSIS